MTSTGRVVTELHPPVRVSVGRATKVSLACCAHSCAVCPRTGAQDPPPRGRDSAPSAQRHARDRNRRDAGLAVAQGIASRRSVAIRRALGCRSGSHIHAALTRTLCGACHPHGSFHVDVLSFTATIFSFSHFFTTAILILFHFIPFHSVSFRFYSLVSHLLSPKPFCTYPTDFCLAVELVCLPYNCLGVVTRFVSTCPSTHSRFAAHRSLASTSSSRRATASSRSRTSAVRSA